MELAPHVSFEGSLAPDSEFDHPPGASLARELETRFRARFGSVQHFDNWRDSGWLVAFEVSGKSLEVYFALYTPDRNSWLLAIAPLGQPGFIARMFGAKPRDFTTELRLVCADVHALLVSTPGIGSIQWFLGGPPGKVPTFATPDQLSWA